MKSSPGNSLGLFHCGYLASSLGHPAVAPHMLVLPCFCSPTECPTPRCWLVLYCALAPAQAALGQAGTKETDRTPAGGRGGSGAGEGQPTADTLRAPGSPIPTKLIVSPQTRPESRLEQVKNPLKLPWPEERPLGLHCEATHLTTFVESHQSARQVTMTQRVGPFFRVQTLQRKTNNKQLYVTT